MSDIAISVENISKKYTIGAVQNTFPTFRDLINEKVKNIFRFSREAHQSEEIIWVLKDISFEVKKGEVIGLIGQNGTGKSTVLKILSRITSPTTGRFKIFGRVGSLLEVGTGFHPELTGRDNVYLNGAILGMSRREMSQKFDEIVAFAEVEKFIDTPIKHYSSGMYVRLAFAVAAHIDSEILIIDEVLSVGDARFQKKSLEKIDSITQEGRTVLFVSHNLNSLERLCTRGIMLSEGHIYKSGEISEVIDAYVELTKDKSKPKQASFKLTEQSYEELKKDGLPEDTLKRLKKLQDEKLIGKETFLNAIKKVIGDEQTVKHKSAIMKSAPKQKQKLLPIFPIYNKEYGITLDSVKANVDSYDGDNQNLTITFYFHFEKYCEKIGVGIIIFTDQAVRVSQLDSGLTGFIIDKVAKGKLTCSVIVDNIDHYIAGGKYELDIDIKIAPPNLDSIMKISNVATFRVPSRDIYNTGRYFKQSLHGIVPLKAKFKIGE